MTAENKDATAGGKYARICELERCQKSFKTNHRHKRFCEPAHQQEYWKTLRGGHEWTQREFTRLRKTITDLADRIEALEGERSENGRGANIETPNKRK